MKDGFFKKTYVVLFGAMICCLLWGSAFSCIKTGYRMFAIEGDATGSQILFAGIRFTLAGILTVIFGSFIHGKILIPQKETWSKILILCMLQTVAQYFFFYVGLAHTTGVKASIIDSMNVFISIFVAGMLFHFEKITVRKLLGCLIGFLGVILVNLSPGGFDNSISLLGEGFIFFSTIAYGFSSVTLKKYSKTEDPVLLSGYQFIVGGVIMIVIGACMGGRLTVVTPAGIAMVFYLAFVSAVAYSLWGILLKYNPVSKVAVFGFMNPVFGVLLSALILGERDVIGIKSLTALVLVSVGIWIVNGEKRK